MRPRLEDPALLRLLAEDLLLAVPGTPPARQLLLLVDQLEELLVHTPAPQRAQFAALLRPALAGPLRVVATLRAEFIGQLLADPSLGPLTGTTYTLKPLSRDALTAVIEGPAHLAGLTLETGLAQQIVTDTGTGQALPLLAFTLAQLAEGLPRGGHLTATHYQQLGGVHGTLTRQAGAALDEAISLTTRPAADIISGLLRLVSIDEQGRPVRSRIPLTQLPTGLPAALQPFIDRRLITTDATPDTTCNNNHVPGNGHAPSPSDSAGRVVVSVAHEAFLTTWPPLAAAISAAASGLRARHAIEQAAATWHQHARPASRLWEGGQLAAAFSDTGQQPTRPRYKRLAAGKTSPDLTAAIELNQHAREFLAASDRRDRWVSPRNVERSLMREAVDGRVEAEV